MSTDERVNSLKFRQKRRLTPAIFANNALAAFLRLASLGVVGAACFLAAKTKIGDRLI